MVCRLPCGRWCKNVWSMSRQQRAGDRAAWRIAVWAEGARRRVHACVSRLAPLFRRDPLPARPLVAVAAAFGAGAAAAGVALAQLAATASLPCWLAAVAGCGIWWQAHRRQQERLAGRALLAATFLAGAGWGAARWDLFPATDLAWQLGFSPEPVALRARIVESPRLLAPAADDQRRAAAIGPASACLVAIEELRDGDRWRAAGGRATVIVRDEPTNLAVGSRVQIFGRALRPMAALNPGEFDFAARARAERCLSIVRVDSWNCVTSLTRPPSWSLTAALDRLRTRAAAILAAGIAAERAPLAAALLLGHREALPRATADDFVLTGTIHVLAISGLHVGLLAGGLFVVFRGLLVPRAATLAMVAAVIGLYAVLVGGQTPVVRATVLVWAACLAAATRRRPATINSLAAAAIVLVAWRPAEVLAPGAQLSFLSTAVLVGMASVLPPPRPADPIERLLDRSRSPAERWLRRLASGTALLAMSGLAVWLATAPLVAARFHVVSPVAVVANVLIAPLVPLAMACGFLCLLAATCSAGLAGLFAAGCDASLAAIEGVVALAAAVPAGHAWVAGPPAWWLVGWYGLLAAAVIWLRRELLGRAATWATLAGGWVVVGLVGTAAGGLIFPPAPGLRVVAAAVGHGCGIVVRSPTGRCLLYDAGRLGSPAAAERSLSAVLWSEGITRIDTLVVSHADADHFNAVPALLERFPTGEILVPEAFLSDGSAGAADLLMAAAARGVPVRKAGAGDSFAVDPLCRVRVLHPTAGGLTARSAHGCDNASSLVLAVETAGRRLLLTGDLEGEPLAAFAASGPGDCDVLLAPHHGSLTSLPADIARATTPAVVLVSGRGGRAWPVVHDAYAAAAGPRPAQVLKTGGEGALAVTLTAGGMAVKRFVGGRWRSVPATRAQAAAGRAGLVSSQPAASSNTWLATYPASSSRTPLVKP
jgi:competence protein ComEC